MHIQSIPLIFTLVVLKKKFEKVSFSFLGFYIISFSFAKLIKKHVIKTNARNIFNFINIINISATACRILN